MLAPADPAAQLAYYRAAIAGLRFVEARSPTRRRFGPDADALWAEIRGHLSTADRLDLLLRDADAEWPGSFAARTVFALRAVAEDEPFGASFRPLADIDAEELWRSVTGEPPPHSVGSALEACARAWGLSLASCDPGPIQPATRLLVAGPSAIAAVAVAFSRDPDLAFSEQVTCVAACPSHRQLAALCFALLNTRSPSRIVQPASPNLGDGLESLTMREAPKTARADRLVSSEDADPIELDWAKRALAR